MGWLSRTFRPASPGDTAGHEETSAAKPPVPPVSAADPVDAPPEAPVAGPEPPTPGGEPPRVQLLPSTGDSSPRGRYGPLVSVTSFDVAPPELEWQLPLNGELYRLMPGSDRPDYSLFVLERPLHFYPAEGFDLGRVEAGQRVEDRKGRTMVRVHAMLLCSRYVGQQLHPGMKDLAVNLAYVIDNSLARDAEVDFGKIEFAATGFLSEGHAPSPSSLEQPASPSAGEGPAGSGHWVAEEAERPTPADGSEVSNVPAASEPGETSETSETSESSEAAQVSQVLDELARTLHGGVEAQRGARVERLTAALTIDDGHRLVGLSGNADGQPPVPTPETFDRLAEILRRLEALGDAGRVAGVTLSVEGDVVRHEVTRTQG